MKYFDEEDAITEYEKQLQKKDNEIERQKEIIRQLDIKNLELTSIIKEIRANIEDIKSNYFRRYNDEVYELCDDILDILDKVDKENI